MKPAGAGLYPGETQIFYRTYTPIPSFGKDTPTDAPSAMRHAEYYQWKFEFGKMRWVRLTKEEYEKSTQEHT